MVVPLNLLFIIGIPLVSTILFVARLAFGTRIRPGIRAGMWGFFTVNMISLFFFGSQVARDFSAGSEVSQLVELESLETDTLSLAMGEDKYEYVWYGFGDALKFTGDEMVSKIIEINIEQSESDKFELVQEIYSRGGSLSEANELAQKIDYRVQQEGDKLIIPPNYLIPAGGKWRSQIVKLHLRVPKDKYIRIDPRRVWRLHNIDFADGHYLVYNDDEQSNGTVYRMKEDGLACIQCAPRENERYFDHEYFSEVKVDGNIRVEIEKSLDDYEVSLEGKHHLLEEIDVLKLGETLVVSTEKELHHSSVVLKLNVPSLKSLSVANTKDVKIKGFEESSFQLNIKGDTDVKAYLVVDSLNLIQSGRNVLDLHGNFGWLDAQLSDHARLEAQQANITKAKIGAVRYSNASLPRMEQVEREVEENSKVVVEGENS